MNEVNLEGFSNRDKKLIRENPDKDAHALLMLGLSQPGYDRLVSRHEEGKAEELKSKNKIIPRPNKSILPDADEVEVVLPVIKKVQGAPQKPNVLRSSPVKYNTSHKGNISKTGQVNVLNTKTGKTMPMSETFAKKLIHGSTDNQYKIV